MRIIGCAVIFISFLSAGGAVSSYIERNAAQINGIYRLILEIKQGIASMNMPIHEILEGFSDRALDTCKFTETAKREGLLSACGCPRLCLGGEALECLESFSAKLGGGTREEQLSLCDYYIGRFRDMSDRAEGDKKSKKKTAKTLSFALGAMTAILFI